MTPLYSVDLDQPTPRQRLAFKLRLSPYSFAATGYYIYLFRRYIAIHGRKTIWYGDGHGSRFVNINSEKASEAVQKIYKMLTGHQFNHFDRYCAAYPGSPWVCGKRQHIEVGDYQQHNALHRLAQKYIALEKVERRVISAKNSAQ